MDMLQRVRDRIAAHNNAPAVARSAVRSATKIAYYRLFAGLYAWAGASAAGACGHVLVQDRRDRLMARARARVHCKWSS